MSPENVESFRKTVDSWNRGDLTAWLETVHVDAEWHPSAALVEGGSPYRGRDGFREFWADIEAAFDELDIRIDDLRDLGDDSLLGLGRLRGRSKQGVPVDLEYGVIIRYRDGLAIWGRSWFDHAAALEAAGLSE